MVCKCRGLVCALPAIALIMALAGNALLAQEKQTPASRPATSNQETNSGKFESRGLKELEQSIFSPLRDLAPESSLDAVMENPTPQRPPPVPNKRAKEEMERRKNWAFMTPEEILTGKSENEGLNPKSAKDDYEGKLSPMERYLQRLYGEDKRKPKITKGTDKKDTIFGPGKSSSSLDDTEEQDDGSLAGLPESVRRTQRDLKKEDG